MSKADHAASAAPSGPRVKPLAWERRPLVDDGTVVMDETGRKMLRGRASTPFGAILLYEHRDGSWWFRRGLWGDDFGPHGDEADAKAAAQSIYGASVLSALEATGAGHDG